MALNYPSNQFSVEYFFLFSNARFQSLWIDRLNAQPNIENSHKYKWSIHMIHQHFIKTLINNNNWHLNNIIWIGCAYCGTNPRSIPNCWLQIRLFAQSLCYCVLWAVRLNWILILNNNLMPFAVRCVVCGFLIYCIHVGPSCVSHCSP